MNEEQEEERIKKLYEELVLKPRNKLVESYTNLIGIKTVKPVVISELSEPVEYEVFKELEEAKSPIKIIEENNWKRHNEQLNIHKNNLEVQKKILNEQKSTSKMTKLIIYLSVITIIISCIGIAFQLFNKS